MLPEAAVLGISTAERWDASRNRPHSHSRERGLEEGSDPGEGEGGSGPTAGNPPPGNPPDYRCLRRLSVSAMSLPGQVQVWYNILLLWYSAPSPRTGTEWQQEAIWGEGCVPGREGRCVGEGAQVKAGLSVMPGDSVLAQAGEHRQRWPGEEEESKVGSQHRPEH